MFTDKMSSNEPDKHGADKYQSKGQLDKIKVS